MEFESVLEETKMYPSRIKKETIYFWKAQW